MKTQMQQDAGALEMTLEAKILKELSDLNESHKYLRVMLMGGVYGEIEHAGRLPLLDSALKDLRVEAERRDERIKSLEEDRIRLNTAIQIASGIGSVVGALFGTIATLVVNTLRKH